MTSKLFSSNSPNIIFLTTTGAGTWTVPADWNSSNNRIECVGGGGSGMPTIYGGGLGNGGGGGGYSRIDNLSLTPGASINYTVGTGGIAGAIGSGTSASGGDTWFNGLSLGASSVGAKGGTGGTNNSATPPAGGQASSGVGTFRLNGGAGGASITGSPGGGGGGGAGGPYANGGNGSGDAIGNTNGGGGGASGSSGISGGATTSTNGGNGGSSTGGAGGVFGNPPTAGQNGIAGGGGGGGGGSGGSVAGNIGGNGGAGAEWNISYGFGGGGGGGGCGGGTVYGGVGGNGGLYGGGGAGSGDNVSPAGNGAQGIIVITYTLSSGSFDYESYLQQNAVSWADLQSMTNSNLWECGYNRFGELGAGNVTYRSSPIQIGSLTNWQSIYSAIGVTMAIRSDGTLWACGYNSKGALGVATTNEIANRSSPVQVGSLPTWKFVTTGGGTSMTAAIKIDGTLWTWGSNASGLLGQATASIPNPPLARSSPMQVGSLTDWKQVSIGSNHALAVKTNGTLWTWGDNTNGQLGLGVASSLAAGRRSSPVQIGSLTNWKYVSAAYSFSSAAIKTDGTLWTWGYNNSGGLGQGNITSYSSPVQVGLLTNWKSVSAGEGGGQNTLFAIKTDGTLWSCGDNRHGVLGHGDVVSRSVLTQVGLLNNWMMVSSNYRHANFIKTDGTLWACGYNLYGNLGLGDILKRSSPVQVGSLTNWKTVSNGHHTTSLYYPQTSGL